ncbi:MAG: hypothetical protein HY023_16080, partial [Chloroflexi bacterium]|nr:hypothetical protein [Chloroflexota bacterium]
RRLLHRTVAEWIERAYAEDLPAHYPLLAHHWSKAEDREHALAYLEKAADQALRDGAFREAAKFFGEALAQAGEQRSGGAEKATASSSVSPYPISSVHRARWERRFGEAHWELGELLESREHFQRTLSLLGHSMPKTRMGLVASLAGQAVRQAARRVTSPRAAEYSENQWKVTAQDDRAELLEVARAYERLGEVHYWNNETLFSLHAILRTANIAEAAGFPPEIARSCASVCFVAGTVPLHSVAMAYGRRARRLAQEIGLLPTRAYVLQRVSIYDLGIGRWTEAWQAVGESLEICRQLGDRRLLGDGMDLLAHVMYHQGDFALGAQIRADMLRLARRTGNIQHQIWALRGQAQNLYRLGDLEKTVGLLQEATTLLTQHQDRSAEIEIHGLLALARWRRGESDSARQGADSAARLVAQFPSSKAFYAFEGYASTAEVNLASWEAGAVGETLENSVCMEHSGLAVVALQRFARVFPFARPRGWLWQGLHDWLSGKHSSAQRAWRRGLAAAEQLAMPYEQALAHYEIGRHATAPDRQGHLARAGDIFARLGTTPDLVRAREADKTR